MKSLYNYLKEEKENEVTVWDKTYDMETYFYYEADTSDPWNKAMMDLAKLVKITEEDDKGVTVDFTELIEKNIDKLKESELFVRCNVDDIMCDMQNILAGYVSEKWLVKFVDILKGTQD